MPGNDVIHPICDRWGRLRNFDFCSTVEPTRTWPYMLWISPQEQAIRVRNAADDDWIAVGGGNGGGGAPDAQYLVLALDGDLSAERRFVPGDGLQATDGGPNGDYTLAVKVADFAGTGLQDDGANNLRIAAAAAGDGLTGGGGVALAVDSTVVRTSGTQSIAGLKTFTTQINMGGGATLALFNGFFSCSRSIEPPGQFIFSGAETNTIKQALLLRHQSSDNADAGFGVRTVYRLDNEYSTAQDAAYLDVVWSDATSGSEDAYFSFKVMIGGASPAEVCRVGGDEIIFSNANVGIGASPGTGYHLRVEKSAVDTTSDYYGFYSSHVKTAGATDGSDKFYGGIIEAKFDQSGGILGTIYGLIARSYLDDGTVTGQYGMLFTAHVDGGSATNVVGVEGSVVLSSGTVGNAYAGLFYADDDLGVSGKVYTLYLLGLSNVDYGIYQATTEDNVFGGHVLPLGNKAKNLGSASNRWGTAYLGSPVSIGTSRLFDTNKQCPVCGERMVRGTGSICILGEDRDFVLAHCLHCGNVAMEEQKHRPVSAQNLREPPPFIRFGGFQVFEMSGNSRTVRVDFQYTEDELDVITDPNGKTREIVHPGITNSTYLSDAEVDELLTLSDDEREAYLLALGQREWDALEDTRYMQEQCASLETELNQAMYHLVKKKLKRKEKVN